MAASILACVYLAFVSAKWGAADFYSKRSLESSLSWSLRPLARSSFEQALSDLRLAGAFDPSHPAYMHHFGLLLQIKSGLEKRDRSALLAQATESYRDAIEVRPRWPMTYASLALAKSDGLQFDDEFHASIRRAVKFGPWEQNVLQTVARLGLRTMILQPPEFRALISESVARALFSAKHSKAMFDILSTQPEFNLKEVLPTVGTMLIEKPWVQRRAVNLTRVAFEFWEHWPPAVQSGLAQRIGQQVQSGPVVSQIQAYKKWPEICPFVVAGGPADQFCKQT